MPRIIRASRIHAGIAACAAALVLCAACQNVPKYKRSSGEFDEWGSYLGKDFSPVNGTVLAVDINAQTITIGQGSKSALFAVTPETRIMDEGTDITLAQLPLNHAIKYTVAADRKRLITVWYGTHSNASVRAGAARRRG
jgi:hypothetical protein